MLVVTHTFVCLLCGVNFKIFLNVIQFIRKHRFRNYENLHFGCTESLWKTFIRPRINTPSEFCQYLISSKSGETWNNPPGHETADIVLPIITVSRTL